MGGDCQFDFLAGLLAVHVWLQNFAYRVPLTIWPFLFSAAGALVIAWITVSWQSFRAATTNPVDSLRYE
jgi:putative ABC transport system permease protein